MRAASLLQPIPAHSQRLRHVSGWLVKDDPATMRNAGSKGMGDGGAKSLEMGPNDRPFRLALLNPQFFAFWVGTAIRCQKRKKPPI
jgi:hypothetical protein